MSVSQRHMLFSHLVAPLGPGAKVKGQDCMVTGLSIDTRRLSPGNVFVALPGSRVDGIDFVSEAIRTGASALVVPGEYLDAVEKQFPGMPVAGVEDCRYAAGLLASRFYGDPSSNLSLVGITGTNGKTTLAYLLNSIFSQAGLNPGMLSTICTGINDDTAPSHLTTPDPVTLQNTLSDMRSKGAGAVVMEVSSHALAQDRVAGCRFRLGIFTNLTRDHLDYHHTMEEYFQAKARLFSFYRPDAAIINIDDPYGTRLWEACGGSKTSYGLSPAAMVRPVTSSLDLDGIRAELATPAGAMHIKSSLIGRHNLLNILAAVAAALDLGIALKDISAGIDSLKAVPGRLEAMRSRDGVTAFVDYAHTPDGLKSVLSSLKDIGASRIITVVGCGGDRDQGKRPEMARIAAELSDNVIFTTDNPRSEDPGLILEQMLQGLKHLPAYHPASSCQVEVVTDRACAIKRAVSISRPGDCVVVAGKGHETYQLLGNRRIPFDDRKVLRCVMSRKDTVRFSEIIEAIGAEVVSGDPDTVFHGVFTDSRSIEPEALFVALKGERFDGHEFVNKSLQNGAAAILVSRVPSGIPSYFNPLVLKVPDTLRALGDLAAWYRRRMGARVVGITGSCGKTSTKELVTAVLRSRWRVAKTKGNFNNLIGLPLSILQAPMGTEWLVLEMGMNSPGEIRRLCEIARPDVGLITNIRPAHLEGLGDLDGIAREKSELFRALSPDGLAIVNLDDPNCILAAGLPDITRVGYSLEGVEGAVVNCVGWSLINGRTTLSLSHDGQIIGLETRLLGRAGAQNALAAYTLGYALGLDPDEIAQGIREVSPSSHRLALITLPGGWEIIDDTYNANPASMEAALETLAQRSCGGVQKAAILGDMLELGEDAADFHRMLGKSAAESDVDFLIAVGNFASEVRQGALSGGCAKERVLCFDDTAALCNWLESQGISFLPVPSIILVKGSRAMGLEKCVKLLGELIPRRGDVREGFSEAAENARVARCVGGGG